MTTHTIRTHNLARLQEEIRETNLSYLMLAQSMIRTDRAEAQFRLGLSEAVVDIIDSLSPGQLVRIAGSNTLICRFSFDDKVVWRLLADHGRRDAAAGLHASIVMASQPVEAV